MRKLRKKNAPFGDARVWRARGERSPDNGANHNHLDVQREPLRRPGPPEPAPTWRPRTTPCSSPRKAPGPRPRRSHINTSGLTGLKKPSAKARQVLNNINNKHFPRSINQIYNTTNSQNHNLNWTNYKFSVISLLKVNETCSVLKKRNYEQTIVKITIWIVEITIWVVFYNQISVIMIWFSFLIAEIKQNL